MHDNVFQYRSLEHDCTSLLPVQEVALIDGHKRCYDGRPHHNTRKMCACVILSFAIGFLTGALSLYCLRRENLDKGRDHAQDSSRISLGTVHKTFNYSSPFSKPPPDGIGSDQMSEPIWDSLIPTGLGYFRDESLAPQTSIPTVFHQLHCLYILRRAYYSSSDELQRFDFGKDRELHVPHCFDYLQQGLTCSSDATVEPAIDHEHGFLGTGVQRQCRDFQELKRFVEQRRVINATGFLANGLHVDR